MVGTFVFSGFFLGTFLVRGSGEEGGEFVEIW